MQYPKEKTGVMVGILLGDGCVDKEGRLCLAHSIQQKDYLLYKMDRLKYFFHFSYSERLTGEEHRFMQSLARTRVTPYLKMMRKIWYKPNKQLTKKIVYKINEEGLCYWYLDDGSLVFQRKNGKIESRKGYLNTQSFTYEENVLLQEMLLTKFNIQTKIHKDKKYYRLYLNSTELQKLIDIIFPYCPSSMYYKICYRFDKIKSKQNLCHHNCDLKNCPYLID